MSKKSFIRGSIVFGIGTLLSRILGMIRDIVVAMGFGAGNATDAFFVVFRFVNLFRAFFAEGAISQAFVPNMARILQNEPQSANLFIGNMLAIMGLVLLSLVGILEITINQYVDIYAFGYRNNPQQLALVSSLLAITLPYTLCICLSALACAVLQTHKRFVISGFSPVVLNICMIVAALWALSIADAGKNPSITKLAWAVFFAGCIQFFLPFIQLFSIGVRPQLTLIHRHSAVTRTAKMFVPVLIAASVTQIGLLVDTLLATFLQTGSVTWLYMANRLVAFPMGVFGISIAVAVLPTIAKAQARGDDRESQSVFHWASHVIFFISLPAACGLIFVAEPIITLLFQYGKFNYIDTKNTADALGLYALGLPGMMYTKILLNSFLASGNTKKPLLVACIATGINIIGSVIFMQILGFRGLALATGFAALVNAIILYMIGRKYKIFTSHKIHVHAIRFVISCAVMIGAIFAMLTYLPDIFEHSFIIRFISVISIIGMAGGVYVGTMMLCGWKWHMLTGKNPMR